MVPFRICLCRLIAMVHPMTFEFFVYILTLIVMGWQYNLLAHILLTIHQPLPDIGESRNRALLAIDVRFYLVSQTPTFDLIHPGNCQGGRSDPLRDC